MNAPTMLLAVSALVLVAHPARPGLPPGASESGSEPLFAVPQESLVIEQKEDLSLGDVLEGFSRVTGQTLVMDGATRASVGKTPVGFTTTLQVPPEEVYPFVEGLLAFHQFVVGKIKGGACPLLGVYDRHQQELASAPRLMVSADQLDQLVDHPALLVQTALSLEPLDVRQLSTSLRGLLSDVRVQLLVAAGSHTVLIGGTGRDVLQLRAVLGEIQELEAEHLQRRAAAQQEEPEEVEEAEQR